jgi:hypothetical protein
MVRNQMPQCGGDIVKTAASVELFCQKGHKLDLHEAGRQMHEQLRKGGVSQ